MSFVHLHRHSEFSRLDGVGTSKQYADRAKELGQPALAQTDHGNLSGALHHIKACQEAGIIPVSGVEAYFRPDRSSKDTRKAWHLCLFAKNLKGWHNLLRVVSIANAEIADGGGFYQYPVLDYEVLAQHSEGLICSTACVSSWLSGLIQGGDDVSVNDYMTKMLNIFGNDLWIEIMPHDFEEQRKLNKELVSIAKERSVPVIATNDAHFPYKEWAETQRIAKMCGSGMSFSKIQKLIEKGEEPSYLTVATPHLYLAHEEEMRLWFDEFHPEIPEPVVDEAMKNTMELVKGISPFLLSRSPKIPKITKDASEAEEILQEWIAEGLARESKRWIEDDPEIDQAVLGQRFLDYQDRVEEEFQVLRDKGVLDYFVLIGKVVRWAKSEGIRVGLGRGSAAGCLVSYLIGITAIDPIAYGLLFERFLNPERKGMPDIDIDFQSSARPRVKAYLATLVGGPEYLADIITHSTFQPKAVIQDLCRVFDVPYQEANKVTSTIDIRQDDEETTLEELLPMSEPLTAFREKYPEIWEHAVRLEGSVRNAGKHAAGIVVTPKPITEFMPLERGKKGDHVTAWSDSASFSVISDFGFMKYDFLGVTSLDKQDYACKLIKQRHGIDIDLNELRVMRDPHGGDRNVLDGFCEGHTMGVFQFGGKGITNLLKEIKPDSTLDITAANALYRPGPMKGGVTWDYAKRKNNRFLRIFWHEIVTPILAETYGIVAYQEQVMKIARAIGGFTGGEADDLRKAMGKLYRIKGGTAAKDFMARYEEKWFQGVAENKIDRKLGDEIWHKILEFGHYGFNKSHSASYALQAYQDMWLKKNYPLEFAAAVLSLEGDEDKKLAFIREARALGVNILPPDVNSSDVWWTVSDDALLFGLIGINGVGDVAAKTIIKNRPFESIDDFKAKCGNKCNKKVIEALTECGAFDRFGAREGAEEGQIAAWEKHRLKMSLTVSSSAHKYADLLNENCHTQDEVQEMSNGERAVVGGEITAVTFKTTKKGDPFANVTLAFDLNEYSIKFWQKELGRYESLLIDGNTIMVAGKKDEWNGYVSIVANQVTTVEALAEEIATATA